MIENQIEDKDILEHEILRMKEILEKKLIELE
jgi:hypothetical protein